MASELYVDKVLHWNTEGVHERVEVYWKSITAAERHSAPVHCGPHESYPLGPECKHVAAAIHLAKTGHGSPDMGCIQRYAKEHGCGGGD